MCTSKVYLTETKGILALKNKTKMENGFQYRSLKKKTQQCSSHHVRERKKTADSPIHCSYQKFKTQLLELSA